MKTSLFIVSFFIGIAGFAQQEQDSLSVKKHELKFNLAMAIAGIPELTYEYFIEDNTSVGLSVGVGLDSPEDLDLRLLVTPYYRIFFGKKQNAGFFIEANAAVATYHDKYTYYNYYYDESGDYVRTQVEAIDEKTTNFGLGAAIGFKLLTRNNYVGEIFTGAGRLFGDSNDYEVYPRLGISLGKRF
ncbi:hypothetical protein [Mesonia aestuariivivens]|uniref:DUF3575 domain-containing protein n=1 Tax=Mesonia aestuariivivens TaxID=2796128 RepID=A0ABS6VXZ6_9FLAO|nr:hypothetical protein [Mesonia aestuariivivens]MBW2960458.1 DUF3575 domain-containing protein [Mesonia aestuariivivens]